MNAYEEKQEARRERYLERAERAESEASSAFAHEHQIADMIPMGQPILVGHHSEAHHRRDIARMDGLMRSGIDASKKAEYYRNKADSVGRGGISSDDPEAVEKLQEKLATMEARQARMKEVNAAHARYLKRPETLEDIYALKWVTSPFTDEEKALIRAYTPRYSWEPHPHAPYEFQNLGGNIRRIRERIEQLSKQQNRETSESEPIEGVRVVQNAEINRVQILFPGKPDEAVRKELKSRGFRWSPMEAAWQRHLNNAGIYAAGAFITWYKTR